MQSCVLTRRMPHERVRLWHDPSKCPNVHPFAGVEWSVDAGVLREDRPADARAMDAARRARHGALSVVRHEHHHPQAVRSRGRRGHGQHTRHDDRPEHSDEERHNPHNSSPIPHQYANVGLLDSSDAPDSRVCAGKAASVPRDAPRRRRRDRRPDRRPDPEPPCSEPEGDREGRAGTARGRHAAARLEGRPPGDRPHPRSVRARGRRAEIARHRLGACRP